MPSNTAIENYSIDSTEYQPDLIGLLKFELRSLYGRTFLRPKPKLKTKGKNLLNLGCGSNKIEDWINADFFGSIKFWKKYDNNPEWMLDLRYPLNCDNNVWDGVFTEHTLEHLYPVQVLNLLKELNRTMKPGAWIRITVPDLKKFVSYYCAKEVHENFLRWSTGCESIRSLTQNYGHRSVWDSELLARFLQESGFINIKEVSFMQGREKLLLKDSKEREWETLYMEAQKPKKWNEK